MLSASLIWDDVLPDVTVVGGGGVVGGNPVVGNCKGGTTGLGCVEFPPASEEGLEVGLLVEQPGQLSRVRSFFSWQPEQVQ